MATVDPHDAQPLLPLLPLERDVIYVGVDIGQKQDPTAIVAAEVWQRATGRYLPSQIQDPRTGAFFPDQKAETEAVYVARLIERLPLGTPYPAVAQRLVEILANLRRRELEAAEARTADTNLAKHPSRELPRHTLLMDATGVGAPVVDLVRDGLRTEPLARETWLRPITFTHGDTFDATTGRMGKAYLVSRLQTLLQRQRIQLPRTQEALDMARELEVYEIHVDQAGSDTYGAFKVGAHDDLATALGLATLLDPVRSRVSRGAQLF